jgi:hypothetical protein
MNDNSWITIIASILGSIVGGGIAGFFTLQGVKKAHQHDLEKQKKDREALVKSLLQSLHDEIETLWETYMKGIGVKLEALSDNQPFLLYYPVTQEYFTVYTGNSFLIGQIDNNDLRKAIIATYTKARGLIDSYRFNNDLLQKYEYWSFLFQETKNSQHATNRDAYRDSLIKYAKDLKESHSELKEDANNVLRILRKQGSLSEQRQVT